MKIDQKMIDEGYISKRPHPSCDYFIYNYTSKCQYENMWNESTMACRGLILDSEGKVIARPFSKFFNYGEYGKDTTLGELPKYNSFDVYEKLDGSLGILYQMPNGELRIATRGSFASEQAIKATEILNSKNPLMLDSLRFLSEIYTFLFEIIYPENRIVVDYGGREELVLLTVLNRKTGTEWNYTSEFAKRWHLSIAKKYNFESDITKLMEVMSANDNPNEEGYVILTDTGFRFKMKYKEYVRLHRIITGVNERAIWEYLKEGRSLDELLNNVPDEFNKWVKATVAKLQIEYEDIEGTCKDIMDGMEINRVDETNRKEVAEFIKECGGKYRGICFLMFDKNEYNQVIWKMIRP